MNGQLRFRREIHEIWTAHFHDESRLENGDAFKKKVTETAEKYNLDAVGRFKGLRTIKRDMVKYVKEYYDRWYRMNYFTLFELAQLIEQFAFYDDVHDELLRYVVRMQMEVDAGERHKTKGPETLQQFAQDRQNVHTSRGKPNQHHPSIH